MEERQLDKMREEGLGLTAISGTVTDGADLGHGPVEACGSRPGTSLQLHWILTSKKANAKEQRKKQVPTAGQRIVPVNGKVFLMGIRGKASDGSEDLVGSRCMILVLIVQHVQSNTCRTVTHLI